MRGRESELAAGVRRPCWRALLAIALALGLAVVATSPAAGHDFGTASLLARAQTLATAAQPASGVTQLPGAHSQVPVAAVDPNFDPDQLADASRLLQLNRRMDRFGPRPTASPNHQRFVDWIERRLRPLPGMRVRSVPLTIDRQLERRASLAAGSRGKALRSVPVSSPVPYSKPTKGRPATGRLVYVPPGESIEAEDAEGRVVIRDAVPGSVPRPFFLALAWSVYDPDLSLTQQTPQDYEREWVPPSIEGRIADLEAAAEAGAAGVVFGHGFPRAQVRGQYAPYTGESWQVAALYVGVDEGERLKRLAEQGGRARLALAASHKSAQTRTLIATLPGQSSERIVVTSHTDGINAVWDNGPIGMLAMAEHFASLPRESRPRTLEFVFTTAHLYLSAPLTAEHNGERIDRAYDDPGDVAFVMALEHLGAREYDAVPRPKGKPGRRIAPTGRSEPNSFFTGESPVLAEAVTESIVRNDLRRSIVLRGADAPGPRVPPHFSFGGEGGAYQSRAIPTIAFITGPWSLFNPAFGMEAIDGELFREQLVVFTDLIYSLDQMPREAIAGGYLAERGARSALCGASEDGFGLARCPSAAAAD